MIPCAQQESSVANGIQTRIAAVHPNSVAILHQYRHECRARRIGQPLVASIAHDPVMGGQEAVSKEIRRFLDGGAGLLLELRRHGLQGQLRGNFAIGMSAHAVGQYKQGRIAGIAVPHAVLIVLPAALAAQLEYIEFHERPADWNRRDRALGLRVDSEEDDSPKTLSRGLLILVDSGPS